VGDVRHNINGMMRELNRIVYPWGIPLGPHKQTTAGSHWKSLIGT